jgi:hypothetical protein
MKGIGWFGYKVSKPDWFSWPVSQEQSQKKHKIRRIWFSNKGILKNNLGGRSPDPLGLAAHLKAKARVWRRRPFCD